MQLPEEIKQRIEQLIEGIPLSTLKKASDELSHRYKEKKFALKPIHRLAYLVVRMPATYAAVATVLKNLHSEVPLKTALDIGAGPGTALFALSEYFPELETISLLEKERTFIELGKKLSDDPRAVWREGKIDQHVHLEPHDLVILAYSVGEFAFECNEKLVSKLWHATKEYLIIIEPGTPLGFSHILQLRTHLLSLGAHIIAPCPHQGSCPENWCHFAARCERSSAHRFLKEGSLNYEDEKFSYLIVSKNKPITTPWRIIRHPEKSKGEILLTLCTQDGIEKKRITKKNKNLYQVARKAEWGDTFSEQLD